MKLTKQENVWRSSHGMIYSPSKHKKSSAAKTRAQLTWNLTNLFMKRHSTTHWNVMYISRIKTFGVSIYCVKYVVESWQWHLHTKTENKEKEGKVKNVTKSFLESRCGKSYTQGLTRAVRFFFCLQFIREDDKWLVVSDLFENEAELIHIMN